jgi:RND superfamily putative drug exporter
MPTANPQNLPALLAQLQKLTYNLTDNLGALASEFKLETNTPFTAYLLSTYFSTDRTTAKVNIILSNDSYSSEPVSTVVQLRETVDKAIAISDLQGSAHYIGGESATHADIMITNDADFGRVTGLATAGILIVIAILLRSLLAPLYMVLTVLLNYGATLGIATWLFLDVMKQNSMIYMLPIFIFVILVALGADYNIFLVSRIREEAQQRPIKEAVSHAVAHTGGVITACGIILAGTFATLTTAPLQVVLQMGAAIAIGILIDTFFVRALLVPALATLAGRWSWWPSRFFSARPNSGGTSPADTKGV